jgi:hypothetical protein
MLAVCAWRLMCLHMNSRMIKVDHFCTHLAIPSLRWRIIWFMKVSDVFRFPIILCPSSSPFSAALSQMFFIHLKFLLSLTFAWAVIWPHVLPALLWQVLSDLWRWWMIVSCTIGRVVTWWDTVRCCYWNVFLLLSQCSISILVKIKYFGEYLVLRP